MPCNGPPSYPIGKQNSPSCFILLTLETTTRLIDLLALTVCMQTSPSMRHACSSTDVTFTLRTTRHPFDCKRHLIDNKRRLIVYKASFPYDRLDHPSCLKKCLNDRDDHMKMLPGRSRTTRTTETTSIVQIELNSIQAGRSRRSYGNQA